LPLHLTTDGATLSQRPPLIAGPRVRIRYLGVPLRPLVFYRNEMPAELARLSVVGSQGTVFHVTSEEWEAVLRLAVGIAPAPVR